MTLMIVPLSKGLIPSIVELIQRQQKRLHTLDPRLPAMQSGQKLTEHLSRQAGSGLVVLSEGRVRGCADIWQGRKSNPLTVCFPEKGGIVWQFIVPDPQEENASLVADLLLTHLAERQPAGSTSDFICWPASDVRWTLPIRLSQHFQLAHVCVFTKALPHQMQECPSWLLIRRARRADTEEIIDLVGEELEYQGMFYPFVPHEITREAYRERMTCLWEGKEGAQEEVLIAETGDEIRGMIHLCVSQVNNESLACVGRVGRIEMLTVRDDTDEQQIAQLLLQAAVSWTNGVELDGYLCWFHPDDPLLTSLLELAGFRPLWTVYGRHRAGGGTVF